MAVNMNITLNPKRVCDTALRALGWIVCSFYAVLASVELTLMLSELI